MLEQKSRPASSMEDEKTIRLARKRFARRQWARRWLVWRGLVAALLVLLILAGAVWLVFFSSVLAVGKVTVEGTQVLGRQEVRRTAQVPLGEPLATVDVAAIAARIESLAPVDRVDVSRSWPDGIRIAVTERVPVAVVEQDGRIRGIDEDGVVFRDYPAAPKDLPLLRIGARTDAAALAEAAAVVGALPEDLAARVDFVEVETMDSIRLRLRDGRTVMWGSADASTEKAKVVAVLLESAPRAAVYDVSVPGQPTTSQ